MLFRFYGFDTRRGDQALHTFMSQYGNIRIIFYNGQVIQQGTFEMLLTAILTILLYQGVEFMGHISQPPSVDDPIG
jgi:hypothetical protein